MINCSLGEFSVLVRTIYGEARGEPREGKIAVAWVIVNRSELEGYGGPSLDGVCLKAHQFSCWNLDDPMRSKIRLARVPQLINCIHAGLDVVEGLVPDPTGGATHYLNPEVTKMIRPDGKLPSWAEDDKITAMIGKHTFYKL
jgi:N-acetylmuramoyl-L-alanine amidase